MADIDMTDAPSASTASAKNAVGKSKADGAEGGEGKKRFEVKKVGHLQLLSRSSGANTLTVERSGSLGLGYSGRQLCYLPKPYHGSLYAWLLDCYERLLT